MKKEEIESFDKHNLSKVENKHDRSDPKLTSKLVKVHFRV